MHFGEMNRIIHKTQNARNHAGATINACKNRANLHKNLTVFVAEQQIGTFTLLIYLKNSRQQKSNLALYTNKV